jgi:hypothetical protein
MCSAKALALSFASQVSVALLWNVKVAVPPFRSLDSPLVG